MSGCKCAACWGFREAVEQITGHEHPGLAHAGGCAPTPLVVVVEPLCDSSMTCPCDSCCDERQARTRMRHAAQPWESKAA